MGIGVSSRWETLISLQWSGEERASEQPQDMVNGVLKLGGHLLEHCGEDNCEELLGQVGRPLHRCS